VLLNCLAPLVFLAIRFGCLLCCFPAAVSFLFFAVVAAYSESDNDLIAFSGRYLSPVSEDFFPLFVLHYCLVQLLRLLCDFARAIFLSSYLF